MQNSFTSKTEAQQAGLAVGYQKWFGIPVASPNLPFSRGSLPAGYLIMSVEDFSHYLIAQLNDGNYQGVSVLSPAGIAQLHHPDIQMPDTTNFYGMGWEVQQYQIQEMVLALIIMVLQQPLTTMMQRREIAQLLVTN